MPQGAPSRPQPDESSATLRPVAHLSATSDGTGLHGRAIQTALDLLQQSQAAPPSLAAIAEALEQPVDKLDSIFPDAHAVLVAAGEQALVRLMDTCIKAVVKVDPEDAVGQFNALGDAYLDWAYGAPMQFRLLADNRLINAEVAPQLMRYMHSLNELMARMLERARDAGNLSPDEDIPMMVMSSRTFAFGLAGMAIDQRIGEWYPDMDPLDTAKMVLRDFVRRIARGSVRRQR